MAEQFPIVGIGASAGGLEAFTELLKYLPTDAGLGFVLVQHLDPAHESSLTEILGRSTSMPVCEVTNNQRVEPNHIYVIPPNRSLAIERGALKLQPRKATRGPAHSIDAFFQSLAQDQRERAIGVILSGTGADGTQGLEAIKAEGGVTFAQDESARYDSMPRNAEATGCVDFVLSPRGIAEELERIAKHPYVARTEQRPAQHDGGADYRKILLLLRNHAGVDFSLYKSTTIQRRIHRRMMLGKKDSLAHYATFLRGNAKELEALYRDCLINVTSFFRNEDAFAVLKRKVFAKLLHERGDLPLRVWVLGCSTGEEAYSLAMAFQEVAEKSARLRKLQVFATDLSDAMLEKARQGLYPKTIARDVSPERLRRFFVEEERGYRVVKPLREMIMFAKQNLISDPPFSRMDLISCRNLLIYLEPSLQQKLMPTFHYALKPGGFLFLGASESVGGHTALFAPVDRKQRIYSKKAAPTPGFQLPMRQERAERMPSKAVPEELPVEVNAQREADRVALNQFSPPGVLINADGQILQFRGATGAFLEPPTGKASFDVLKMAREGLLMPLRNAISKAKKENKTARKDNIPVRQNGKSRPVNIEVIPLKNLRERCFLILFKDADGRAAARPYPGDRDANGPGRDALPRVRAAKESPGRIKQLQAELSETRDYLQSMQEQHDAANEELQSSNEEIQSANEELQSLNEELETSKEELESANEELVTLNEELAVRNTELKRSADIITHARDYAEAIVRTAHKPVVILDAGLHVLSANEPFYRTFKVSRKESEGQLIYELGNGQWNIPELRELLEHILPEKTVFNDFHVTHDFQFIGKCTMVLNARTLESVEGEPAAILLGIEDMTAREQTEIALRQSEENYRSLFQLAPMAVYTIDSAGVIQNFNQHAAELWGREPKAGDTDEKFCGSFKMFRPDGSFMPHEQCPMAEVVSGKVAEVKDGEVQIERPDGSRVVVLVNIRPLKNEQGELVGAINCFYDITHRKQMENELAAWQRELESRVAEMRTQLLAEATERRRLEAEVAGAVELEQERLGQELHDGLAQELTGIGMLLDALETKFKKAAPAAAKETRRLREMLGKTRDNARNLAKGFFPVELERNGLIAALRELAERCEERFGIPVEVEADGEAPAPLNETCAIQLFRIAQEAVHNAGKHAKAKRIVIRLATQNSDWVLTVKDDGVGFPAKKRKSGGMGLRIMQYRARLIDAKLEVRDDDTRGVIVSCIVPRNDAH